MEVENPAVIANPGLIPSVPIASLWSAYLETKITAHDVALMMTLLKLARTKAGKTSDDTYIDMAAYSAIAGELKE
jgi:hypothetical protein